MCVKTQEELYQKVRLTTRLPRDVLRSNSECSLQDLHGKEARSSWDSPSNSKSYGETRNNIVDYRISGMPLSTVEQQDAKREKKVNKLIEKFEEHQRKESHLKDLGKESKNLIADMSSTEVLELCDKSSKQQLQLWKKY